ncbi:conserved hypothetical protein [Ricinus communis]|uniref:Protein NO VEIN C-terminal domain-containing protein n=1 Tax=Ricinus communis TaxID=3988 RepID=B9T8R8_RICCO|nr:conserved hypothetical protein [Ricinus communis]
MHFVSIDADGHAVNAGWAPHLDLIAVVPADRPLLRDVLESPWIRRDLESVAVTHASAQLVPAHLTEVKERRERQVDKTLAAVHERLVKEIDYWSERYIKLKDDLAAGKDVRLTIENVRRTIDELTARKDTRERELRAMRQVVSSTPVAVGGALIIPAGLWAQRKGDEESTTWAVDAAARSRVERIAMQAVFDAERAMGHVAIDVSAKKIGWDITSQPPDIGGASVDARHIEVKGRAKGQTTITVTRNEIIEGLNQGDKFYLAVVMVDGDRAEPPLYIRRPFEKEPDWRSTSVNYDIASLLQEPERDAL